MYFIVGEDDINIVVDKSTVGQFTGLYDKNKTPIYERGYSKKRSI